MIATELPDENLTGLLLNRGVDEAVEHIMHGFARLINRSPARLPSLPGIVARVLRPRTMPAIPSSRISRSTVCLDTPGNSCPRSHAVIFRRP